MSKESTEDLVYFDGAKGFDNSISIPGAKLDTDWMDGWMDYIVCEK